MDILFVDDNLLMQQVVARFLESLGYEVLVAGRGDDALTLVTNQRPRLLLVDLNLPDTTGEDILQAMRTQAGCATIPAIALSGLERADISPVVQQCFVDYLQKPFDLDELERVVRLHIPPLASQSVGA